MLAFYLRGFSATYRIHKTFPSLKLFSSLLCKVKRLMQRPSSRDKRAIEFPAAVDPSGEKLQAMWEIVIHTTFRAKRVRPRWKRDSCCTVCSTLLFVFSCSSGPRSSHASESQRIPNGESHSGYVTCLKVALESLIGESSPRTRASHKANR